MAELDFTYFELAHELNINHHKELLKQERHFRPNFKSVSLVSLNKNSPELGKSGVKNVKSAEKLLNDQLIFRPKTDAPKPEKELQAWIILTALKNKGVLPFLNDLTFITSELVFPNKEEYGLELKNGKVRKDIRNDILAIDPNNRICVIELKYGRSNVVKWQAVEFAKVVRFEREFFLKLVKVYTGKDWNGEVRMISVWPGTSGKPKKQEFVNVEEVNYHQDGDNYFFN